MTMTVITNIGIVVAIFSIF